MGDFLMFQPIVRFKLPIVVAIAYAVASIVWQSKIEILIPVAIGFILTIITWISELLKKTKEECSQINSGIEELSKKILSLDSSIGSSQLQNKNLQERFRSTTNLLKSLSFHLNKNDVIRRTGEVCFDEFLEKFKPTSSGLDFQGEEWSVKSYANLWRTLKDIQNDRQKNNEPPLHALMTHSNSIKYWIEENYSNALYRYQEAFGKAGGQMKRILIGKDEKPNEQYRVAMDKMEKLDIVTEYLSSEGVNLNFDFLWVPEIDLVAKWTSKIQGETLSRCEILGKVSNDIKNRWHELEQRLENSKKSLIDVQ